MTVLLNGMHSDIAGGREVQEVSGNLQIYMGNEGGRLVTGGEGHKLNLLMIN